MGIVRHLAASLTSAHWMLIASPFPVMKKNNVPRLCQMSPSEQNQLRAIITGGIFYLQKVRLQKNLNTLFRSLQDHCAEKELETVILN